MRPVEIPAPGLLVAADVAAAIAPILVRELQRARTNRRDVPGDVVETIEKLDLLGAAWTNRNLPNVPTNLPPIDTASSAPIHWTTVKSASDILDRTTRAVTGLLERKTLHGEKSGAAWRVCIASVEARTKGSTCPH